MKKQYWVSEEHNFKRKVVLFEDDRPASCFDGFFDDVDIFIKDIEKQGYVKGYLRGDVREIWNKYKYMLDRMIDYGDSPWDVEISKNE